MKLTRAAIGLAAVGAGWLVSRTLHLHEDGGHEEGGPAPADKPQSGASRGRMPSRDVQTRWTAEELDRASRRLH